MVLQSIMLRKSHFTKKQAMEWLAAHKFKSQIDTDKSTKLYYHARQAAPKPGAHYYSKRVTEYLTFRWYE